MMWRMEQVSAETGAAEQMGYRPALDGLRGVAAAVVVAFHLGWWDDGFHGVTVFFVLSGYLITGTLLAGERVDLRGFYVRRVRRLMPASLAALIFCLYVNAVVGDAVGVPLLAGLTYSSNWVAAAGVELGATHHFWSLAIEEQFYLLWPLVVLAVPRRWLGQVAVAGAVASAVAYRMSVPAEGTYLWFHTRVDALLIGCALCVVASRWRPPGWLAVAALLGLVFRTSLEDVTIYAGGFTFAALCAAVLIAHQAHAPNRLLASEPLRHLGKISYGVYLWHFPILLLARWAHVQPLWLVVVLSTWIAAECSYRWIEEPFRSHRLIGHVPRERVARSNREVRGLPDEPLRVTVGLDPANSRGR